MSVVYRIMTGEIWHRCQADGVIAPSPLDQASGFMHLSGPNELLETADRYFPHDTNPIALEFDAHALGAALRWEAVAQRGGVLFPHLYAQSLDVELIRAVITLSIDPSGRYMLGTRQEHGAPSPQH